MTWLYFHFQHMIRSDGALDSTRHIALARSRHAPTDRADPVDPEGRWRHLHPAAATPRRLRRGKRAPRSSQKSPVSTRATSTTKIARIACCMIGRLHDSRQVSHGQK